MFTREKPLPPPPAPAKPRNESLSSNMSSYRNRPNSNNKDSDSSGFSFAGTKSLFESLNKPEIRNGIMNTARNPTVQKAAISAAKNEQVRNVAYSAAKDPKTREAALNASQTSAGRGAIMGLAKQFENKPVMGFAAAAAAPPSFNQGPSRESFNNPTTNSFNNPPISASSNREMLYPSLTGDSAWQNRGPAYDGYNTEKIPPARPPPPKLGSRSIPNLSSYTIKNSPTKSEQIIEPHASVKYPYNSDKYDELNCESNDIVLLKREVDDQWIYATNTRTGQSGIVPISFLSIKVPLVPTASSAPMPSFSMPHQMPSPKIPASSSSFAGFLDKSKFTARALYDYDTGVDGDLKFKAGDLINVTERIDVEWLRGEANYHRGIFPLNYVECEDLTSIPMAANTENAEAKLANSFAQLSYKPKFVTALYNYYSGVKDDLVFEEGDRIQIVEELGGEWIKGLLDGREGLVPLTYVEREY